MRLTLPPVFGLLALLGLAAFLSLIGAVIAHSVGAVDLPEDESAWVWISIGWLGLIAAFIFGTLAVIASKPAALTGVRARRIGLGLLGGLCLLGGLALLPGGLDPVSVALVAVGAAALVVLWRDMRRERGGQ